MKFSPLLLTLLPTTLAQSICGATQSHNAQGWYLNNNEWGASTGTGTQCTYIDSINTNGVSWHTDWTWAGEKNSVKSFPYSSRLLGTKKKVSEVKSITNVAEWRCQGSNLRVNVAYDLFTAGDPNHPTYYGDYELMVWLGRFGDVQPLGENKGTVTVGGRQWTLFMGVNHRGTKVFSYMAQSNIQSWNSDILPFFKHMESAHGFPASSQYLLTFQFGTEPFTGNNARFIVGHWSGNVN